MPTYNVRSQEGLRRVQQLAYACGVLAIFRHDLGTEAVLSDAAWLRMLALVAIRGKDAPDIWTAFFATGYADALRRRTRGRARA